MSENNTSMFVLAPVSSPEDIIKNMNYTETRQIISDVETNINNFISKYDKTERHEKMSKTLKFVCDELIKILNKIKNDETRIWNFITETIIEIAKEKWDSDDESIKKHIERLNYTSTDGSDRFIVKDAINKYIHDYKDAELFERMMLIYDNYKTTYFAFATNIIKLYNTLVDIYQISEINKAKRDSMQPDPSECDKCNGDIYEGCVCPVNGKHCYKGKIVTTPDWSDSSWFYSY